MYITDMIFRPNFESLLLTLYDMYVNAHDSLN
jgi:hypothetical protein